MLGRVSCLCDEASKRLRAAKYPDLCTRRIVSDGLHEKRTARAAIWQDPRPKVSTLMRAFDRPPCTTQKRKVQENDCVCRTKPDLHSVVRSQVTIHDPSVFDNKLLLNSHPLVPRCREQAGPPEDFVQLNQRKSRDLAQALRESRFARCAATDYDHPFHSAKCTPIATSDRFIAIKPSEVLLTGMWPLPDSHMTIIPFHRP
jgi:hypothetical protein